MGLMESVHSMLGDMDVDELLIAQILSALEQGAADVERATVRTSAEGRFGGSEAAATLSWDASVAHAKVVEAMSEMVAGLQQYADKLVAFKGDTARTDDEAAAAMTALNAVTTQIATPTIAASGGGAGADGTGQG